MSEVLANQMPVPAPAPNPLEGLANRVRNTLALTGAVVASAGIAAPENAQAGTENPLMSTPQPTLSAVAYFENGRADALSVSSESSSVTVLQNVKIKGTPKHLVRKAEKQNKCFNVGKGTAHPEVWTEGYNIDKQQKFGLDTRKSRVCRIGGKLVRVACDNEVRFGKPKNAVEGQTLFVKSFSKTKINVKAKATAQATCKVGGAEASAYGEGEASGRVYARTLVRGKGKGKTLTSILGEASGKASADAKAQVSCSSETAVIVVTPVPPTPPTPETPTKPPMTCDPNIDVCK